MSALAELAAEADTIASLGHNQPPEPTPFEAVSVHIDDLLTEAHNWADGEGVETQAQADDVGRLIEDLRKAAKVADDLRIEEARPFDEGKAAVQARYAPLIADPKTKNPGKVWKAIDALKATLKPYLDRLRAEQEAEARSKREEAEAAAQAAREAAQAAAASDFAAQEDAEALIKAAEHAAAEAKRAENAKAQSRGGGRAIGLRTFYRAEMTDRKAALLHYLADRPDVVVTFLQAQADADVRAGKRSIPGFNVVEDTRL